MSAYEKERDRLLSRFREDFKDHRLVVVVETEAVTCVRLAVPGTGINSVQITFTPEGIAVQGDAAPGVNGVCSSRRYGRAWFAGELAPSYLGEKFLRRGFVPDVAEDHLRELLAEGRWSKDVAEEASQLLEALGGFCADLNGNRYAEFVCDNEVEPRTDYDPIALSRLQAIQETFARLWREHVRAEEPTP